MTPLSQFLELRTELEKKIGIMQDLLIRHEKGEISQNILDSKGSILFTKKATYTATEKTQMKNSFSNKIVVDAKKIIGDMGKIL